MPGRHGEQKIAHIKRRLHQPSLQAELISKDFMNWRIRMSLRLFGMPQRKKQRRHQHKRQDTASGHNGLV
jgi:hypothetical protein